MSTHHRRLDRLEHQMRTRADASPADRWAAMRWAMTPADRATWAAMVAKYEAIYGTDPAEDGLTLEALEPADLATLIRITGRARRVLGWPIREDMVHYLEDPA